MQVARLFEEVIKLNKKIAEVSYKISYYKRLGKDSISLEEELENLIKERNKKIKEIQNHNLEFFVPFEEEIKKLNDKIKEYSIEQIDLALRKKQGSAWELLKGRALLTKNNLLNSKAIGKLAEFLIGVEEEKRKKLIYFIRIGEITEGVEIEEELGRKIAKYLNRVGIKANYEDGKIVNKEFPIKEVRIELDKEVIYVPKEVEEEILKLKKDLQDISVKIQIKNAEKKIRVFSKGEEEEFERLQKEYLKLLKKKEEVLKKYNEE